ncbi:MAG: tyrosine-type recombinase/integrase [Myxococcota bacterium]
MKLGRTRAEALQAWTAAQDLKARGLLTPERLDDFRSGRRYKAPNPERATLATAWAEWQAAKSEKRSFRADVSRWKVLVQYLPESTPLASLSVRQIDEAILELRRDRGIKPGGANRYKALIRAMLRLAADHHELRLDPSKIKTPREASRQRVLSHQETEALVSHLQDKGDLEAAFAVRFLVGTACRSGELGRLLWTDVDLRAGNLIFRETKAGGSRMLDLPSGLVALLRDKKRRAEGARVLDRSIKRVSQQIREGIQALGFTDTRIHDLRRTAASRMLEAGIDARTVQSITGHADLQMLLRVYHSPSAKRRREALDVLQSGIALPPDSRRE